VTIVARCGRFVPEDILQRGAEFAAVDRKEPDALAKAIGASADAVIDTIAYDVVHARQLLAIEENVGAFSIRKRLSRRLWTDARSATHRFSKAAGADYRSSANGRARVSRHIRRAIALERTLLEHAKRPVAILRPCASYGNHNRKNQ
jgi:hypothetical protein